MKKGLAVILTLGIASSSLFAFNKPEISQPQGDNNNKLNINISADSIVSYETTKELRQASKLVIKGEVLEKNSYMNGPAAITENKIKVTESYNGNVKVGDVVTVVSAGGTVTYEEYASVNGEIEKEYVNPKTLKGQELELSFEGSEQLEIGKEYVIFASMQKIDAQGTEKYCIEGINQGLFKVDGNTISNDALSYTKNINLFKLDME